MPELPYKSEMTEKLSAYRLDSRNGKIKRVDLNNLGNWVSVEHGLRATHIEGDAGDIPEQKDGIQFLVEHDFQNQYPFPRVEKGPRSGATPRFESIFMHVINRDGEYLCVETLVVYDCRIHGSYLAPRDSQGKYVTLSNN